MDEQRIQDRIRKLLQAVPEPKLPEDTRRRFISWLYGVAGVPEERMTVLRYVPLRRVPVFAGALATVLVFMLTVNYLFIPLTPLVSNVEGTVKIFRARNNEWVLVNKPQVKLFRNDILKTYQDGQADISIPRSYQMRLKANSEIRLAKSTSRILPGNIKYDLAKGRIFTFYKGAEKREFDIETPEATATAVGTDFMVEAIPQVNRTWVGVLDGIVKVTGRDIAVLVNPGEKTVVRAGSPPATPQRLVEDELLELEELYRIGEKRQVALLISTGKTRVRELLSLTLLYVSSEKPGVLPEKIVQIAKTFHQAIKDRSKEKIAENIKQFEELVDKNPNPKYDVQFLLFIAAYYEYLGEHEKAIETFQRIIDNYPDSNLASIAQCAIGIIHEEKLGDKEKAGIAYQKVLSNYPNSPEIEEATEGLARLSR